MPFYLKKQGNALDPNTVMYYVEHDRWSDQYNDRKSFPTTSSAQEVKDAARVGSITNRSTIVEEE